MEQDDDDQDRQHPLEIGLELGRELDARALVGLGEILVKAPAPLRDAEQQIHERADGQQEVAHKEVLAVEHVLAENGVEVAPDVVAEHAGKAQEHQQHAIDENGLLAAPAEGIHADGEDVFKHRQHRRHAGKNHEEEEERAPEAAAGHVDEHLRQRDKEEGGAIVGRYAVGEARGEDDRAGHERNERIERADADGLTGEGVIVGHVAAEDLHRRNAERECEEGLIHRVSDEAAQAVFTNGIERGEQVELHALCRAGERQAVNGENEDEREQRDHHHFGHALKALLKAERADDEADDDDSDC